MTDEQVRDRTWLRGFLDLGARREQEGIDAGDIQRQEDTVLRALAMLDVRPGVVLADEVGLGKTYEALGVAAAFRRRRGPDAKIVVVTPGPDLNDKWRAEFVRFRSMYDFGEREVHTVRRLPEFVEAVRAHPIVVAPVTMFMGGRGGGDQAYLISLFCHWRGFHFHTTNALLARFRDGSHERIDPRSEKFLERFTLAEIEPHLEHAFRRVDVDDDPGLDDLYETGGKAAFESANAVRAAIYRARFRLVGCLTPEIELLIVDEAHKLKSGESLRVRGMRSVFERRFRRAVFLTATPFQLDIGELQQVFSLFNLAIDAPKDLDNQIDGLLLAVREYQAAYDEFQTTWAGLDLDVVAAFSRLFAQDPALAADVADPTLALVVRLARELRRRKEQEIEPGFRQWMIRSLNPAKRQYRRSLPTVTEARDGAVLPFLVYERFVAELFRQGRPTHKAAVEINMASSYAAASGGSLMHEEGKPLPESAEAYRCLLREVLGELSPVADTHPKIEHTIRDALDAVERGEKTLVFCARVATLDELRRRIDAIWLERVASRWREAYPGLADAEFWDEHEPKGTSRERGRHSQLQGRFHRPADPLYLALRERYLHTIVPIADWAIAHADEVAVLANRKLRELRVGETAAHRRDYQLAKRCVEQAAVELRNLQGPKIDATSDMLGAVLDERFVVYGLDLEADEFEGDEIGDHAPIWSIDAELVRIVVGDEGGLWIHLQDLLPADRGLRVRVVEQLARYLTMKQVPLLAELLAAARRAGVTVDPVDAHALRRYADHFWETRAGEPWSMRIGAFLEYFEQRDERHQVEILDGPIKRADFVRHTKEGESRERLREAFNTPLYPMILLANEVMQEGLDLHRNCRRIVHHDLTWNPAQIEQRIGRIDRLGSLTHRLRKAKADINLDVLFPQVSRTIDERMYRAVRTREKWLEFLLGAQPDFDTYNFTGTPVAALPEGLPSALAIDLGPRGEDT